jgi:hypothetical protein
LKLLDRVARRRSARRFAGAAILAMKYEVGIAFHKMNESIDLIASVIGIKLDSQPRRVDRNSQTSLREPLAD